MDKLETAKQGRYLVPTSLVSAQVGDIGSKKTGFRTHDFMPRGCLLHG